MPSDVVASGIIEVGRLEQYLDVFTPVVAEGRMHFNDGGIVGSVVDPANVAMLDEVRLDAGAWESYEAPGAATIGINFERLTEVLGPADSGDLVELQVDMATRHLELSYGGIEQSVALIDPDSIRNEPDTPDLDLPNMVVVEGRDIETGVDVAQLHSDHLDLIADPDNREVRIFADGDTDSGVLTLSDADVIDARVDEHTKSIYSLDFWEMFVDPVPADSEVTIHFGDAFPVEVEWAALEGWLSVSGLIAPRIQSD